MFIQECAEKENLPKQRKKLQLIRSWSLHTWCDSNVFNILVYFAHTVLHAYTHKEVYTVSGNMVFNRNLNEASHVKIGDQLQAGVSEKALK